QRVDEIKYAEVMPVPNGSFTGDAAAAAPEFQLHRTASPIPRFDFADAPSQFKLATTDTHGTTLSAAFGNETESLDALRDLRPLGQIHDSFIIAAGRDGLWIIDQHVAHERILFEQVLAARSKGSVESQRLLVPHVISLTAAQQIEYARIADELNSLGFE